MTTEIRGRHKCDMKADMTASTVETLQQMTVDEREALLLQLLQEAETSKERHRQANNRYAHERRQRDEEYRAKMNSKTAERNRRRYRDDEEYRERKKAQARTRNKDRKGDCVSI